MLAYKSKLNRGVTIILNTRHILQVGSTLHMYEAFLQNNGDKNKNKNYRLKSLNEFEVCFLKFYKKTTKSKNRTHTLKLYFKISLLSLQHCYQILAVLFNSFALV